MFPVREFWQRVNWKNRIMRNKETNRLNVLTSESSIAMETVTKKFPFPISFQLLHSLWDSYTDFKKFAHLCNITWMKYFDFLFSCRYAQQLPWTRLYFNGYRNIKIAFFTFQKYLFHFRFSHSFLYWHHVLLVLKKWRKLCSENETLDGSTPLESAPFQ